MYDLGMASVRGWRSVLRWWVVGLCLVGGLLCTVGSAWGISLWHPDAKKWRTNRLDGRTVVRTEGALDLAVGYAPNGEPEVRPDLGWPVPVPDHWPPPFGGRELAGIGYRCEAATFTGWVMWGARYEMGFPLPALRYELRGDPGRGMVSPGARTGIVVREASAVQGGRGGVVRIPIYDVRLPTTPHWGALVVDTLFWGALLWVVFVMPVRVFGWMRRRRRVKRGLCPVCAYPAGPSDRCPECGDMRS
jgi:hypothetical protein